MGTNNATNTSNPITVAQGGSGLASTTAYAVLCGGTTSTGALQSIASVGTSNQVLTSNGAGALPTFQTPTTAASTAFDYYRGAAVNGVTGDNTQYIIVFDTKDYETGGSNFNTGTGTYTIPSAGFWLFGFSVNVSGFNATNSTMQLWFELGGTNYNTAVFAPVFAFASGSGTFSGSFLYKAALNDTAQVVLQCAGSATKNINVGGTVNNTRFWGCFLHS